MEYEETELRYTVFKRYDNGMYAMRFTLPGHSQIRIGLGTRDRSKAYDLAERKYMEAEIRAQEGLLLGVASFDKLAQEYLDDLEKDAVKEPSKLKGCRYAKGVVERYLIPYFGRRNITAIRYKDLVEYVDWRRVYWTEGQGKHLEWLRFERGHKNLRRKAPNTEATASTLRRETSIVRGVFKQGVKRGFLRAADIPKVETGETTVKKRPAFTKEQFAHLVQVARGRVFEVDNPKQKFERELLLNFIVFAANSGMRTMEMYNLDWRHIDNFQMLMETTPDASSRVGVLARGKKRPPQRIFPRLKAVQALESTFIAFEKYFGRKPESTDPVFCNYKGGRITTFNNSLKALLKAANLLTDANDDNFTAYCFRHSYATWALQRDPPVDVYTLSNNMRTSVEMIQKWYSKSVPEDQARILTGEDEWPVI
ncbi:MAG: tyrosine-type recombinase/integrase [Sulfitobacter sp.]